MYIHKGMFYIVLDNAKLVNKYICTIEEKEALGMLKEKYQNKIDSFIDQFQYIDNKFIINEHSNYEF